MFDEIVDLESIHKQKCEISERELKLSAPKLKTHSYNLYLVL